MRTKPTLTIDQSVIEKARIYAKQSGRSLSDLVETYLQRLTSESELSEERVPEEFKDSFGSVNLQSGLDEKAAIREIMSIRFRLPQGIQASQFELSMLFAAKLFEEGLITSGQGAEMLGLSKRTFMELLGKYKVSVFQYRIDEIEEDIANT